MGSRGSGFSEYGTPRAVNSFFGVGSGGVYDVWENEITTGEKENVYDYTGSAYEWMNESLRKDEVGYLSDSERMKLENVAAAISKFELKRGITVYRNSTEHLIGGYTTPEQINQNLKGAIVQDKGYMSTTPLKSKTNGFFGEIRYEIKVPKGKGRGAWVNPISHYKNNEWEFLIQRGTRFRVTGAHYDNAGNTVVQLRVL